MHVFSSTSIVIARPPERVFDFATAPENLPTVFPGFGPIPGIVSASMFHGSVMRTGALRRVSCSDGSVIEEEILAFERPRRQSYRMVSGFKRPFALLVKGGQGDWTFAPDGNGNTRVAWDMKFDLTSPIVKPLGFILMRFFFQKAMGRGLARLKERLETAA